MDETHIPYWLQTPMPFQILACTLSRSWVRDGERAGLLSLISLCSKFGLGIHNPNRQHLVLLMARISFLSSVQDAIDKGAFKSRDTIHEGQPNMINIMRTATEIAGAMSYLHSLDILHSDLNGNNILLISNTGIDDRPFSVKVCLVSLSSPSFLLIPLNLSSSAVFPFSGKALASLEERKAVGSYQGLCFSMASSPMGS